MSPRGRGFTVALIGPDGAGKTTVAGRLPVVLPMPLRHLYMGVSTTGTSRLLPTTRLVAAVRRRRGRADGEARRDRAGSTARRVPRIRAVLRIGNRIAEESHRQLLASWHVRRGRVVVFDRHFFADYYAHDVVPDHELPWARRVHGWFLRRVLPRPELMILLDADPSVLLARKGEGTVASLERMRGEYMGLAIVVPRFVIIDADRPLEQVTADVAAVVRGHDRDRSESRGDRSLAT